MLNAPMNVRFWGKADLDQLLLTNLDLCVPPRGWERRSVAQAATLTPSRHHSHHDTISDSNRSAYGGEGVPECFNPAEHSLPRFCESILAQICLPRHAQRHRSALHDEGVVWIDEQRREALVIVENLTLIFGKGAPLAPLSSDITRYEHCVEKS
jgi:hypothetical protein